MRVGLESNHITNKQVQPQRKYTIQHQNDAVSFCSIGVKKAVNTPLNLLKNLCNKIHNPFKLKPLTLEEEYKILEGDETIIQVAFKEGYNAVNKTIKPFIGKENKIIKIDTIFHRGIIHCKNHDLAVNMIKYFKSPYYTGKSKDNHIFEILTVFVSNKNWKSIEPEYQKIYINSIKELLHPTSKISIKSKQILGEQINKKLITNPDLKDADKINLLISMNSIPKRIESNKK
jgi:hypothetical protein